MGPFFWPTDANAMVLNAEVPSDSSISTLVSSQTKSGVTWSELATIDRSHNTTEICITVDKRRTYDAQSAVQLLFMMRGTSRLYAFSLVSGGCQSSKASTL